MEGLRAAAEWIGSRSKVRARVAVVLGDSAMEGGELIEKSDEISVRDIPAFPSESSGLLLLGSCGAVPVAVIDANVAGEGDRHGAARLLRVLHLLGVKSVLLVGVGRAVGTEPFARGLLLAEDQINLTGWNPLVGANLDEFGPRFPDMSEAFDVRLRRTAMDSARRLGIPLQSGIFAGVSQPQWDQEIGYEQFRKAGADMVGVGLVPEVIVACHMGVRVLGLIRDMNDRSSGALLAPLIREIVKEL